MSRILLGVSGGIAAYKALEFVRLATGAGHARARRADAHQPPLRRHRRRSPRSAALPCSSASSSATPRAAPSPTSARRGHDPLSHLELVANAELFLIAPASANTIAKLAAGLADNLLTSCALAADCPLLIAPAMNARMYEHPATRQNLAAPARAGGVVILEPDERPARLRRASRAIGRLAEPREAAGGLRGRRCARAAAATARPPADGAGDRGARARWPA